MQLSAELLSLGCIILLFFLHAIERRLNIEEDSVETCLQFGADFLDSLEGVGLGPACDLGEGTVSAWNGFLEVLAAVYHPGNAYSAMLACVNAGRYGGKVPLLAPCML